MARGIRRLGRGGRAAAAPGRADRPLRALLDALPPELRAQALTHSSWVENRADSYGRLAFLGDSVLGLALAEHLFRRYPRADIGRLTKIHGQAVSGRACAEVAVALGVPELLAGRRPERARGRDRRRRPARQRARARLGLRGGDRRLLPPPRLRDHRGGHGGRVRDRARARLREAARLQVGAPGAPGPRRGPRKVRGHRRVGTAPRPLLRGRARASTARFSAAAPAAVKKAAEQAAAEEALQPGSRPDRRAKVASDRREATTRTRKRSRLRMHLSSITIKGFKSFPERTKLVFSPGVSVIVGPNGCGKSNITDAVLWALGEQSPLSVRGQSMQDMIYAGGEGVGPQPLRRGRGGARQRRRRARRRRVFVRDRGYPAPRARRGRRATG